MNHLLFYYALKWQRRKQIQYSTIPKYDNTHFCLNVRSAQASYSGTKHSAWLCTGWALVQVRSPLLHPTWMQLVLELLPPKQLEQKWQSASSNAAMKSRVSLWDIVSGFINFTNWTGTLQNLKRWLGRRLSGSWALRSLLARQAAGWTPFWSISPQCPRCWTPPAAAASAWTCLSAERRAGPLKDTAILAGRWRRGNIVI